MIPESLSNVQHQQFLGATSVSPERPIQIDIDDEDPGHVCQVDHTPADIAVGSEPYDDVPNASSAHQNVSSFESEAQSPAPPPAGFPDIRATSIALLHLHIPDMPQIWYLVDYHEKYLLWYHGCYHGPTFRAELCDALQRNDDRLVLGKLNLQWVALLFSVMAGSVACASAGMLESWGFGKLDIARLPPQWYEATLTCLHLAGYTRNHSIYAVHAITTLSMSAHPLGFSEELAVLLSAAQKIAQSLQLDRLDSKNDSEVVDETSSETHRKRILQREVGRRLWSQLCVQDWFSLPSGGSLVPPNDFTTIKPSNRDHVTMAHIDDTYPTYVSYGNYLNDIAKLMAEHHIEMARACTPYTRYEKVLLFDKKMRKLAKEIPGYFSVTTPIDPSWPVFIPWARRSLTICFAHKIIMIHRAFISSSFTSPAFQITRNTCIAAAKTILKEAKQDQEEDEPRIWIDQAFCVAAGIILCLDVMHRSEGDSSIDPHTELVEECIGRMQRLQPSAMAVRGTKVLSVLLTESKQAPRPTSASGKRGPPTDLESRARTKRLRISKLISKSSKESRAANIEPDGVQARGIYAPVGSVGDAQEELEPIQSRVPQLLPPQAGFSNDFIFNELLDLWM